MSKTVLLDAQPLGLLSNPNHPPIVIACRNWAAKLHLAGWRIIVPEIADYEVRRELLRAGKTRSILLLDQLTNNLEYLALTTAAIRKAAELWALARQQGKQTAPDPALDGDVILAAQTLTLGLPAVRVATSNAVHLSRYVHAENWDQILP